MHKHRIDRPMKCQWLTRCQSDKITKITGEAKRTAKTNDNKNFDVKLHNESSINQNANSPSSLQYFMQDVYIIPCSQFSKGTSWVYYRVKNLHLYSIKNETTMVISMASWFIKQTSTVNIFNFIIFLAFSHLKLNSILKKKSQRLR